MAFAVPHSRPAFAASSLVLDTSNPSALHESTIDCAAIHGSWSNFTGRCTVSGSGSLAYGSFMNVDQGAELHITSGTVFNTYGYLHALLGTISIDQNANMSISSFGRLANSEANGGCGTVTNDGNITNDGVIDNSCTFANNGEIDNAQGAFIYAGSYGGAGASFVNQGTINNNYGGAIQIDSNTSEVLSNPGQIWNGGWLQLYSGNTVEAQGANGRWYFSGSFESTGSLHMADNSTLTVGYGGYTTAPTVLDITSGSFRIPPGVTVYVASSAKLKVEADVTIDNYGFLSLQSGQSTYKAGNVTNYGTITNENLGMVNDNGTIVNEAQGVINNTDGSTFVQRGYDGITYNYGRFSNMFNATVDLKPYAIVNNNGPLESLGWVTIFPNASLTNNAGGTFVSGGGLDIQGNVTNNAGGVINTTGAVSSDGTVMNQGGTINQLKGSWLNNGSINNTGSSKFSVAAGAALHNNATISNEGLFALGGSVNNSYVFRNSGDLKVSPGGELTNSGGALFSSTGSALVSGTLTNAQEGGVNIDSGTVDVNGTLQNSGSVKLSRPAALRIDAGGSFSNGGVFGNHGGLYVEAAGTLTNSQGGSINTDDIFNSLGTIVNSEGATMGNAAGGNMSLFGFSYTSNAGSIANAGNITRYCRAVMYTTGSITGNPVKVVSCSSLRSTAGSIRSSAYSAASTQRFSLTVTVNDTSAGAKIPPSGAVMWSDEKAGGSFGTSGVCTLARGSCTIVYTSPPMAGTFTLNATYEGDMVHQPSTATLQLAAGGQPSSSSTQAGTTNGASASGSGPAGPGSGGIPEFPGGLTPTLIATAFVVLSFIALRRRASQ
jgi:hypothetical protein